jgi:hypothetical protein
MEGTRERFPLDLPQALLNIFVLLARTRERREGPCSVQDLAEDGRAG